MPQQGLLHPEPVPLWWAIADLYLCRRHSNNQRQAWLSVCGIFWCAQGFVWALWASLAGMGFDSKHDFAPPTILLGFSFALGCGVSFLMGIQHSPVDGCSATSCNFGVLAEDEHTSFYSAIVLEAGSLRTSCCQDWCLVRSFFLGLQTTIFSFCP